MNSCPAGRPRWLRDPIFTSTIPPAWTPHQKYTSITDMATTHTASCLTRADQVLMEELDTQGITTAFHGPEEAPTETIPAWGNALVSDIVATWLSDGTAACTCDLHR